MACWAGPHLLRVGNPFSILEPSKSSPNSLPPPESPAWLTKDVAKRVYSHPMDWPHRTLWLTNSQNQVLEAPSGAENKRFSSQFGTERVSFGNDPLDSPELSQLLMCTSFSAAANRPPAGKVYFATTGLPVPASIQTLVCFSEIHLPSSCPDGALRRRVWTSEQLCHMRSSFFTRDTQQSRTTAQCAGVSFRCSRDPILQ
jgi:hypothetical protein